MRHDLARAAGSDLVNVWLNVSKVLIVILYLFVDAASLHLNVGLINSESVIVAADQSAVVSLADPNFEVPVFGYTLWNRSYDRVGIHITQIQGPNDSAPSAVAGGNNLCSPGNRAVSLTEFADFNDGERISLPVAELNLLTLLNDSEPTDGEYRIFYRGLICDENDQLMFSPEDEAFVTVRFDADVPPPVYFSSSVVEGQWFEVTDLRGHEFIPLRYVGRNTEGEGEISGEPGVFAAVAQNVPLGSFRPDPSLVVPGLVYDQEGDCIPVEGDPSPFRCVIRFTVKANRPPESNYVGPNRQDANTIVLYLEYHRETRVGGAEMAGFILDQYIVDPDGQEPFYPWNSTHRFQNANVNTLTPAAGWGIASGLFDVRTHPVTGDRWLVVSLAELDNRIVPPVGVPQPRFTLAVDGVPFEFQFACRN